MRDGKREQILPEIEKVMRENGGIVKASQLYPLGLTYRSIQELVADGFLDHVKSGYYSMNYKEKSEESIICGLFQDARAYNGYGTLLLRLYQSASLYLEHCGQQEYLKVQIQNGLSCASSLLYGAGGIEAWRYQYSL